jgi:hypothetical protein
VTDAPDSHHLEPGSVEALKEAVRLVCGYTPTVEPMHSTAPGRQFVARVHLLDNAIHYAEFGADETEALLSLLAVVL